MDLVTHALSGPLIGRAGLERHLGPEPSRRATWLLLVAALAPDIDNLLFVKGTATYLDYHRGFTHSFAGGIVVALVIAALFWLRRPRPRFQAAFLLALTGVYAHIFLDLITSYGTQIFYPFTLGRYGLNLVFIIDPLFTFLFTLPFVLKRRGRGPAARLALGAIAAYLLLCGALNLGARAATRHYLVSSGMSPGATAAFPRPPSPLSWFAIDVTPDAYRQFHWSLWHPRSPQMVIYPRAVRTDLLQEARQQPDVRAFLRFSRYPYIYLEEKAGTRTLNFFDLRFNGIPDRSVRPFLLRAVFDDTGHVTRCGFVADQDS